MYLTELLILLFIHGIKIESETTNQTKRKNYFKEDTFKGLFFCLISYLAYEGRGFWRYNQTNFKKNKNYSFCGAAKKYILTYKGLILTNVSLHLGMLKLARSRMYFDSKITIME